MIAWSYVIAPCADSSSWLSFLPKIAHSWSSMHSSYAVYSESFDDVTFTWNEPQ